MFAESEGLFWGFRGGEDGHRLSAAEVPIGLVRISRKLAFRHLPSLKIFTEMANTLATEGTDDESPEEQGDEDNQRKGKRQKPEEETDN